MEEGYKLPHRASASSELLLLTVPPTRDQLFKYVNLRGGGGGGHSSFKSPCHLKSERGLEEGSAKEHEGGEQEEWSATTKFV